METYVILLYVYQAINSYRVDNQKYILDLFNYFAGQTVSFKVTLNC